MRGGGAGWGVWWCGGGGGGGGVGRVGRRGVGGGGVGVGRVCGAGGGGGEETVLDDVTPSHSAVHCLSCETKCDFRTYL